MRKLGSLPEATVTAIMASSSTVVSVFFTSFLQEEIKIEISIKIRTGKIIFFMQV